VESTNRNLKNCKSVIELIINSLIDKKF